MTDDHLKDFTRDGYRRLMQRLLDRGYSPCDFHTVQTDATDLIVRHDIDFSPEAALPIGEIERSLGIGASYFFLVTSPFYDIEATATRQVFETLLDQGHTIGLHFDAAPHASDPAKLEDGVAEECTALEAVTGSPVTIVSFHRPAPALLGREATVAGRPHTYQPVFFVQMGYCSDSRGRWRHGHPLRHPAVANGTAVQLLTHPIWWANDDAGNRERALQRLIDSMGPSIRSAIADTVTGYDAETGVIAD